MTPNEMLRVHCTALGFMAVILKNEPVDHQALRAQAIARMIETFCHVTVPEILEASNQNNNKDAVIADIDRAIDDFKTTLRDRGDARLPEDRTVLLAFFDRLQQRQAVRKKRHFYATGTDDMIADAILKMIDEELAQEA